MKVLAIFVDMLRSEQVYTEAEGWKHMGIKRLLEKIGGTFFSSCYTPSPDSYRSFGCFWSSLYPKKNGTMYRYIRTYDGIEDSDQVFLKILKDAGYQFNAFVGAWKNDYIGLFHNVYDKEKDNLSTGRFLKEFLKTITIEENSFTFFNLEDLHWFIDDEFASRKAFMNGVSKTLKLISMICAKLDMQEFDDIIIFSDHGFRYYYERGRDLLDSRRSNIVMFWHKKGDKGLGIDHKLRSIMDVYPTVLDCCGLIYDKNSIQGKNLFDENGHDYLIMEEHNGYLSGYLEPICQWGVIDKNKKMYFADNSLNWHDINGLPVQIQKKWDEALMEHAVNYRMLKEMIYHNSKYGKKEIERNMEGYYSDGARRRKKRKLSLCRRIGRKAYCLYYMFLSGDKERL